MPRSTCAQPPLVTLFLFVVVYVRLVLDPTLGKTKKLISAVVNGYAAALAAYYVLSLHGPPRNEGSFSAVIIFVVMIPALFTLTAALILYSQTVGCFAGTAAVFLALAYLARFAVALWIFPSLYPDMLERTVAFACFASPVILVAAVAAIPSRPRLGYVAGLIAAALAWPHFVYHERGLYLANSWNLLNLPDSAGMDFADAKLTIIAILFLVVVTACSLVRLCPANWSIKGRPLRDRIWLVLAASFVVSIVWFVLAATPYTVPRPHHGVDAEIYVVYVEKRGFRFRETSIAAWRDGKAYVT
jgi:hypothetical protein